MLYLYDTIRKAKKEKHVKKVPKRKAPQRYLQKIPLWDFCCRGLPDPGMIEVGFEPGVEDVAVSMPILEIMEVSDSTSKWEIAEVSNQLCCEVLSRCYSQLMQL
jgi:hypothetical protein